MKTLLTTAALALTFAALPQLPSHAAFMNFSSTLSPAQEIPPPTIPAGFSPFGTATGSLSSGPLDTNNVFTYILNYSGLTSGLQSGHIHIGAPGTTGPVVHPLDGISALIGTTSGTITGDWRFDDPTNQLTDALAQNLMNGNLYFNLHTSLNTPGEIRGQITAEPVPEPTSILGLLLAGAFGASSLKRQKREV